MRDNREATFVINDVKFILNRQYSSIGYCYPRLFVELVPDEDYGNIDLTLGTMFKMNNKDWNDWLEDADGIVDDAEVQKLLAGCNIDYDVLVGLASDIASRR